MAKNFGGLVRLTLGRKESGNGRGAERQWETLSGIAMNLTVEFVVIACICGTTKATLEPILSVLLLIRILFVTFSCNSVSFSSLCPSTKVGWSYFY